MKLIEGTSTELYNIVNCQNTENIENIKNQQKKSACRYFIWIFGSSGRSCLSCVSDFYIIVLITEHVSQIMFHSVRSWVPCIKMLRYLSTRSLIDGKMLNWNIWGIFQPQFYNLTIYAFFESFWDLWYFSNVLFFW